MEIPVNVDYELTKIWIAQQDLSNMTPEMMKQMFFETLHKMQAQNVERWD